MANLGAGAHLLVTPERLLEKSQSVLSGVSKIKGNFQTMEQKMKQTSSYWVGEAGSLYRKTYSQFKDETEEILGRLKEHAEDLNVMAGIYHIVEGNVQQISNALPDDVIQ
jgi:WXG100 family type VII secretion target